MGLVRGFLHDLVKQFDFTAQGVDVSLTYFWKKAFTNFSFNDAASLTVVDKAIDTIFKCCQTGDAKPCCDDHLGTSISTGIRKATDAHKKNGRPDAQKVNIILTDGCHNIKYDPKTDTGKGDCASAACRIDDLEDANAYFKSNFPTGFQIVVGVAKGPAQMCPNLLDVISMKIPQYLIIVNQGFSELRDQQIITKSLLNLVQSQLQQQNQQQNQQKYRLLRHQQDFQLLYLQGSLLEHQLSHQQLHQFVNV